MLEEEEAGVGGANHGVAFGTAVGDGGNGVESAGEDGVAEVVVGPWGTRRGVVGEEGDGGEGKQSGVILWVGVFGDGFVEEGMGGRGGNHCGGLRRRGAGGDGEEKGAGESEAGGELPGPECGALYFGACGGFSGGEHEGVAVDGRRGGHEGGEGSLDLGLFGRESWFFYLHGAPHFLRRVSRAVW